MTPAKLLVLMNRERDRLALAEMPVASLACLLYNINRDPGDKDKGIPPAPLGKIEQFLVFKRKKSGTLDSKVGDKDPQYYSLHGAVVDKGAWMAWAQSKGRRQ